MDSYEMVQEVLEGKKFPWLKGNLVTDYTDHEN